MPFTVLTKVVYLNQNDLDKKSKNKKISDIEISDFKNSKYIKDSNVAILKLRGEYKVIKSRF